MIGKEYIIHAEVLSILGIERHQNTGRKIGKPSDQEMRLRHIIPRCGNSNKERVNYNDFTMSPNG